MCGCGSIFTKKFAQANSSKLNYHRATEHTEKRSINDF